MTDGCRGHGGVEARQGLGGGAVLVEGDDQSSGGFDAHDRREGCQRDQRQIGGECGGNDNADREGAGRRLPHGRPAARSGQGDLRRVVVGGDLRDLRAGPVVKPVGLQFGRGGLQGGEAILQRACAGLHRSAGGIGEATGDKNAACDGCNHGAEQGHSGQGGGEASQHNGGNGAGPQAPGRRAAHEEGLNRVHVLNQPGRDLAGRQVQSALGRACGDGVEQLRAQAGERLQGSLMARDALNIAPAGADDGQQADDGAGHHVVEALGGRRARQARKRRARDEPARQAQQTDGRHRDDSAAGRSEPKPGALGLSLGGDQAGDA